MDINNMNKADLVLELESHGIELHPATGVNKLRATLQEVLKGTYKGSVKPVDTTKITKPVTLTKKPVTLTEEQAALRLIRIIVTPNDPLLNSYPGMIFTVSSSSILNGKAIKKYVPFNNEEGWHVPHIIYEMIRDRQCQVFTTSRTKNGIGVRQSKLIKEFAVEVLPDLTEAELAELAQRQAMAKSVD